MRCLFLDLASHSGLIACTEDRAIKASEPVDHRIGDHELIPLYEEALGGAGWESGDLTHIACVIGPGGFMSLRVAVAFANTLMHTLKILGAGIHLSDVYAARVGISDRGHRTSETFLWLHSTKKNELFVRGFGALAPLWPEATHVLLENFLARVPSGMPWAGELIAEHEALLSEKHLQQAVLRPLVEALPAFLHRQAYTENLLEPWYGRGS